MVLDNPFNQGVATTAEIGQAQVAALLVQGLDTTSIAHRLYVSEHTVYDHVKAILSKAGVRSRRELVATIA